MLLNAGDDVDEMLSILIGLCKEEAYVYCNLPSYDTKLDFVVIQMVIERYNRIGSEGTTSQASSGISASYDSFYSNKVIRLLNKYRRIKTL